jgi:hypothetical protein
MKLATRSGTLVTVFEHFSDGARRILVLAQEEARNLDGTSIGPEHLFLAMLREGEGIAAEALSNAGIDYYQAREVIENHGRPQLAGHSESEPFSRATMRVMERALQISWVQADARMDTEHLLVALLEQCDEAIEDVLTELDITPQEVLQLVDVFSAERAALESRFLPAPPPSALALALGSDKARRLEVLEGVLWGVDHLGEVVELLQGSGNRRVAREALMAPPFELSQNQATGVLDLSVDSVTADRRKQIVEEIELLRQETPGE